MVLYFSWAVLNHMVHVTVPALHPGHSLLLAGEMRGPWHRSRKNKVLSWKSA